MGPKRGRKNVRKIEIPTATPTEFEMGDIAVDILLIIKIWNKNLKKIDTLAKDKNGPKNELATPTPTPQPKNIKK